MTHDEKLLFSNLLFSHKHLWITFQEHRYLTEFPEMDYETVHEKFCDEADPIYESLAVAVREEQPIQDSLQTVLLHSQLTQNEALKRWKDR